MTKLNKWLHGSWIAVAALAMTTTAEAEVLMSDNFEYDTGNLYKQGSWVVLDSKKTDSPIQVQTGALTFEGYQPSAIGKSVVLNGGTSSSAQRLQKGFATDGITSGTLCYSILVKPTVSPTSKYLFAGFSGKNYSGWGDGIGNTSIYAAASLNPGSTEGKFKFGIAASTSTPTIIETEYDINRTYLVVVSYDFTTKDIKMWINPTTDKEAATITLINKGSISTTNGVQALCLYQGSSPNAQANVVVDAVRVGNDISDLLTGEGGGGGEDPDPPTPGEKPTISLSMAEADLAANFVGKAPGAENKVSVSITAENLEEDLIISCTSTSFTVTPTTISASDALAGNAGFEVAFTPKAEGDFSGTVTVGTASHPDLATMQVSGYGIMAETPMNYAFLSNQIFNGSAEEYKYYYVESRFGTVTYVDTDNMCFYIQDMVGALKVSYVLLDEAPNIHVGSKISGFYVCVLEGALQLAMPIEDSAISEGTPKTPTPYRVSEMMQSPESYWNKLVQVEDASFANAGESFAAASTAATDANGTSFYVRPFAGSDIIGTTIPQMGSISGIMVAKNGNVVWPRSAADLVSAPIGEPSLEITQEKLFTDAAAPINEDTEFAKFTIVAENLQEPTQIHITGTDAGMFSLSHKEIPVGSGTYTVKLTYHPDAIGKHKANVMFEAVPTEFSSMYQVNAAAYDPQNPPTITVPASVEEFVAAPGTQQQKSFTISSINMFDYGTVAITEQSTAGSFLINNTSLLPNDDYDFTITFKPDMPGEYTATIKVSAPMAEDRYINLTGKSQGDVPEPEKEGTELILDKSNPLTLLNEDFQTVDAHNKPLMLNGWDNVAMTGLRAWWGYKFDDDNNVAAKVTAYDSKADSGTPCEMLLVTPALDFKNSASKVFTCDIMGDFLPEGGTQEALEVLYIEDKDWMQPLQGMNIPAQADYNKEWVKYVIDFEGQDLADVFFIGFRLKATRGRDNSSIYYVDNVSWGRTDIPQIKTTCQGVDLTSIPGNTVTSDEIEISALNLTEDIKLSVVGANASKFSVSTATLPKEGGTFTVSFSPEEIGLHEAYVQLISKDAPALLIPLTGHGNNQGAIYGIDTDNDAFTVISLQGIILLKDAPASELKKLPDGMYIINGRMHLLR